MLAERPLSTREINSRFDALFERFYPELYGLTYRVLGERMAAEDILQDTFLKLSDDQHIQERPDPEVGAWLRRVSLNLAFNRIRGERRAQARLERVGRLDVADDQAQDAPASVLVRLEDQ